jgi:hypothetical protein
VTASIDFFETPQDISERPLMPGLSRYLTGMSRTGTYKALGRGELKVIKLGSKLLLDVDHGLAWLRSQPAAEIRAPKAA